MRSPIAQAVRLAFGTASALGLARFAYGLLLPAMREDLGWSLAQAGALSAANGFGYLLGALLTPLAVRRAGDAAAFRWSILLTAAALAATAATGSYPVLLALRAAAGLTGAVVFITGGVIAARLAARVASGAPLTLYFAGTGLGIALSGAVVPALGGHWRTAWLVLGAAGAAAAAVSWSAAPAGAAPPSAAAGRARVRPLWRVAVAYLLFATGYITYITFLSAYLADRHASVAQVTLIWTVLGLAVVAAPVLWSGPLTTWPGGRALAVLLALLGGGAALALVSPALPVVLASALVYGATFMCVPAAVTALIRGRTEPGDWTATLAAFTMLFALGQTAGPWLAGVLADRTSTDATLAWTAALCTAAALVAAAVRPPPGPASLLPVPAGRTAPEQGEHQ
ncbi:putative MFS family arabinose efflux permease [Actinocorallia herbida]|uniref:Putative MFS family arabinose efflux permease n=1 Tax=Actinocorallia herbida TaxID=58109 RepID=A0A3N1D1V5_9ACTN|nr:YbfB/YjiJ family MFS transporter [Actinocorallia herbida]ROO87048.1 putative MFS family arabinose efflux permease [Actinocorallia herbida]